MHVKFSSCASKEFCCVEVRVSEEVVVACSSHRISVLVFFLLSFLQILLATVPRDFRASECD